MAKLSQCYVEEKLVEVIDKFTKQLKKDVEVTTALCPGEVIVSQVLIAIMERVGLELEVVIPNNIYIFHDAKNKRQLSIKEAAAKLISIEQKQTTAI